MSKKEEHVICYRLCFASGYQILKDVYQGTIFKTLMHNEGPCFVIKTDGGQFVATPPSRTFCSDRYDIKRILEEVLAENIPLHIDQRIARRYGLPEVYRRGDVL